MRKLYQNSGRTARTLLHPSTLLAQWDKNGLQDLCNQGHRAVFHPHQRAVGPRRTGHWHFPSCLRYSVNAEATLRQVKLRGQGLHFPLQPPVQDLALLLGCGTTRNTGDWVALILADGWRSHAGGSKPRRTPSAWLPKWLIERETCSCLHPELRDLVLGGGGGGEEGEGGCSH